MCSTSTVATSKLSTTGRLKLIGNEAPFGDFRDDLVRDGYAVVKGAVSPDQAAACADEMYKWLESFNLGFDRNDPSTVHKDKLPVINEKGMCIAYALIHEDFVWKVRSAPGVIAAFEKVFATPDLIVSFDAVNFSFPNRTDLAKNTPWAHQDQDPLKPGFRCLQGLVNILPNGSEDGGLIVCKGAHLLSSEFHEEFKEEPKIPAWTPEWYGFTDRGMEWLKQKGCEWTKVCAEPGDLLIWDSRTPHYNVSPTSNHPRFAVYTCMMPVADASQEDLKRKRDAFRNWVGTTHWPNAQFVGDNVARIKSAEDRTMIMNPKAGVPCPYNRFRPINEPRLSERGFRLTGIPYIEEGEG